MKSLPNDSLESFYILDLLHNYAQSCMFPTFIYLLTFENPPCFPGWLPAIFILIGLPLMSLRGLQVFQAPQGSIRVGVNMCCKIHMLLLK